MKKYNKENCQILLRKTAITFTGKVVCLIGRHAFEWTIVVEDETKVTKTIYKDRKSALKEFNRLVHKCV